MRGRALTGFSRSLVSRVLSLALVLSTLLAPNLTAETPSPLFGGAAVSGEWVVYRDRTWPSPTWVGFIQYDGSTWGVFLKTPSSSSDVRVLFRTEEAEGALILTGQQIISSITQADVEAVNYLMGLLPELWKWSAEARLSQKAADAASSGLAASGPGATAPADPAAKTRSRLLPALYSENRKLPEFGGSVTLSWAAEVPVFALAGIRGAGKEPVFEMVRTGRASSSADTGFFSFEPIPSDAADPGGAPDSKASGPAAAADPAKTAGSPEKRRVDSLELSLDGNWTMYADNTFFMANDAVLIVASIDSLSLGPAGDLRRADLPLELYALFTRSSESAWEVPGNRNLSGSLERFRIDNLFYDRETGTFNRDIKLCIPAGGAKEAVSAVRVVSLSVRESVYRANPAYFDNILPR